MNSRVLVIGAISMIFALITFNDLVGDWGRLEGGWSNLEKFFEESLWPPNWSVLEAQSYPVCQESVGLFCSVAWMGMIETIKIAFVSTAFGFVIALPLAAFAANNLSPKWVSFPSRVILSAMRSLPSIIWAILFVIIFDIGTLAGIFAMTFYTVGYLGKLQFESIEGIRNAPLEAARAMGMTRAETTYLVAIPESANNLLSHMMFMFEYNVRHGTVIGLVGAGGIGLYLNTYLKMLQYDKVVALLIIVFAVVVLIDMLSMIIRSKFTEEGDVQRPSWSTIFLPAKIASLHHHGKFIQQVDDSEE